MTPTTRTFIPNQEHPVTTSTVPTTGAVTGADGVDLTRIPGQPFARLVGVELRKSLDTRSGRWVLAALLGLSLVALGWEVWLAGQHRVAFLVFLQSAHAPVGVLLPVLGILAMTSEWSQRTALTTFTLSPRRVPVLLAKVVATLLLTLAVAALVTGFTVAATALGGVFSDGPVNWTFGWRDGVGIVLAHQLNVLMGVGIGALLPVTALALTGFFVAPAVVNVIATNVLKAHGEWLNVFAAFSRIASLHLDGKGPQTLTAVGVWVVLPTVLGLWLSAHREVK